ncbi:hypothetical protein EIMP300_37050 [Escherichia coli]|uniref:Uncharacterized protein n=1 Tax=Escherichia coli TaxID=562 RepID=A0A8S0FPC8_ECOLX|nr:hypothetical protein EIMP300_37050 [Escherichia coli]
MATLGVCRVDFRNWLKVGATLLGLLFIMSSVVVIGAQLMGSTTKNVKSRDCGSFFILPFQSRRLHFWHCASSTTPALSASLE